VSDAATLALIEKVHAENYGVYGIRKALSAPHSQLRRAVWLL